MHYITPESLEAYRAVSNNLVHESMSLYSISHDSLMQALDAPDKWNTIKQKYKKYRGRLDATPTYEFYSYGRGEATNRHHRLYDKSPTSFSTKSMSAYSSDSCSDEAEDDQDGQFFLHHRKPDFSVGKTTSSVSITDNELFEENDEEYKYDPT
mmetsp:Transcript_10304/g.10168  ORF Transcript_10304/g.10168 Transcript_10304/m.10168 type:complete len:153 (-) Transcript_10304:601-1059(-)